MLKQGPYLIATIQGELLDADLLQLQDDLAQRVGQHRSSGVIIDVTALDVMDSFATRTLRTIGHVVQLRGADAVIVGIQPDVAFAMVQLGLTLEGVETALDFEEGLALLNSITGAPITMAHEARVRVISDADIVTARQEGRTLATTLGFSTVELTLIATAISEIARNIAVYAGRGEILLDVVRDGGKSGIKIVAGDEGPGIPDVDQAMRDGYSTGKSLGLGLPGAKRIMDEFELVSTPGEGTTITMTKWKK